MMRKIKKYISNPKLILFWIIVAFPKLIKSDRKFLELKYYVNFEKWPDLDNPKTYSEKIQWLKLYNRRPEYVQMVDKAEAKKYVSSILGDKYIIPTIAIYNRAEDINFDELPNRFVLKCTHDSGGIVICKDKNKLDKKAAIDKLKKGLERNFFWATREWPYKNVVPRIIAEEYIEPRPNTNDLPDYKFFCFDGEVKGLFVATERQNPNEEVKFDFFDADFNHLKIRQGHENARVTPQKPESFDLMKKAAAMLSKGFPHVRVDLYDLGENVLFGELTLFHFSGMVPFEPEEWDMHLGEMINLPCEKLGGVFIKLSNLNEIKIVCPDLQDYKFFCFNGEPKYCQVISGRGTKMCIDFFDKNWNHQPFHEPRNFSFAEVEPKRPNHFEEMMKLAAVLSKGMPFSRIDFYDVNDKVYFGEITFYPTSGIGGFDPVEWDEIFGSYINLSFSSCTV